ncbi:MAG: outer membrane beta-barrel protein [Proteobacteria bacterium]|nr:outer membrane beta-barrel protein [Pseudomonadota bacterium]
MHRLLILYISLLFSFPALSQEESSWQFVVTPVLWNASVDARGSGDSGGDISPPDYSFFTLDNLDSYLSIKFEANRGSFGILFDSLRARYEDTTDRTVANIVAGSELGFIELSARYQISHGADLDLIAGVRRSFLDIDVTLSLSPPLTTSPTKTSENVWTDPIIGLRYHHPFSDNWHGWVRGDIGGFNVDTKRMYNFTADVQYLINRYLSFSMGYRYFKIDFKDGDILSEVTLNGLQIGLGIHF